MMMLHEFMSKEWDITGRWTMYNYKEQKITVWRGGDSIASGRDLLDSLDEARQQREHLDTAIRDMEEKIKATMYREAGGLPAAQKRFNDSRRHSGG